MELKEESCKHKKKQPERYMRNQRQGMHAAKQSRIAPDFQYEVHKQNTEVNEAYYKRQECDSLQFHSGLLLYSRNMEWDLKMR
jgi:hypothetical protein